MTTTWLILARAVHIGACLLFFGIFAFDRFVATTISASGKTKLAITGKGGSGFSV